MGASGSKASVRIENQTSHPLVLRDRFRTIYGQAFGVVKPNSVRPQNVLIRIPSRTYFRVAILLLEPNGDELPTGLHIDLSDLVCPADSRKSFRVTEEEPNVFHLRDGSGEEMKTGRVLSGEILYSKYTGTATTPTRNRSSAGALIGSTA